jgi:hypothetical protein
MASANQIGRRPDSTGEQAAIYSLLRRFTRLFIADLASAHSSSYEVTGHHVLAHGLTPGQQGTGGSATPRGRRKKRDPAVDSQGLRWPARAIRLVLLTLSTGKPGSHRPA